MKNLLKSIITTVLVAAILISGISVDTITATAKTTKGGEFKNGGSVTLKPGDELKLTVTDTNHLLPSSEKDDYDVVSKYKWSSSDTSIIKVETDIYDETKGYTECVTIIAVGSGTATVTGKSKSILPDVTMTVNVTLPKATAKQKKCKHSYKVTKKATCERAGIKTCKKCKFQKAIKKLEHKYVNKKKTVAEYDYFTDTIWCNNCPFTCTIKYDTNGNVTPDSDYPSYSAAVDGMNQHIRSVPHIDTILPNGMISYGGWNGAIGLTPYGPGHAETYTVKACKYCGKEKEPFISQADRVYLLIQEKAENQQS